MHESEAYTTVVVVDGYVVVDGRGEHGPGATLEVTPAEARRLVALGVAAPAGHSPAEARGVGEPTATADEYCAATLAVAAGQTTRDGRPTVEALEGLLGRQVSAAERDAIWEQVPGGES